MEEERNVCAAGAVQCSPAAALCMLPAAELIFHAVLLEPFTCTEDRLVRELALVGGRMVRDTRYVHCVYMALVFGEDCHNLFSI